MSDCVLEQQSARWEHNNRNAADGDPPGGDQDLDGMCLLCCPINRSVALTQHGFVLVALSQDLAQSSRG